MHLPQDLLNGIIVSSILVGFVQCFFGYRIFKLILGLTGFFFGGSAACAIAYTISQQEVVAILSGIIGGFIGAAVMSTLYFIGIFLIGTFLGGVMGAVLSAVAKSSPDIFIIFIAALIGGIVTLIFQKSMIIVSTGFLGAWSAVTGIAYFITGITDLSKLFIYGGSHLYVIVLCWLALGTAGTIVQYKSAPAGEEKTRSVADGEASP